MPKEVLFSVGTSSQKLYRHQGTSMLGMLVALHDGIQLWSLAFGDHVHRSPCEYPERPWINLDQTIDRLLTEPHDHFPIPCCVQGTPFQLQVWQALVTLPRGVCVTYADLARMIGRPTAIRAVASACAANRLALVIPCHRVIRSDGGLGGYRWGVERKRWLLEHEADCLR